MAVPAKKGTTEVVSSRSQLVLTVLRPRRSVEELALDENETGVTTRSEDARAVPIRIGLVSAPETKKTKIQDCPEFSSGST